MERRLLRAVRQDRRLSQDEIARRASLSGSVYNRIERGHRQPTDDERKKIAAALGAPKELLFDENGE